MEKAGDSEGSPRLDPRAPLAVVRCLFLGALIYAGWQQLLDQSAGAAVIESDNAFFASGGHDAAIRADTDGVEKIVTAAEIANVAAVVHVPKPHGVVAAACDKLRRLSDELEAGDLFRMPGDGADLLPFFVVPDFDDVVRAGAGQQLSVGLPADIQYVMGVALERLQEFSAGDFK